MLAKILPSLFTVGNLCLGIVALILTFQGEWQYAAIAVIIGMLLDGLDGRVARMLNTQSEFGKELDSLSDIVTFGVAPAFIMYVAVLQEIGLIGWIVSAIFPVCGALRLARFNVKAATPGYFIGLPITAAGGALATMALFNHIFTSPHFLTIGMVGLAVLMVSSLKYPSFHSASKRTFWIAFILMLCAVVLAVRYPHEFPRIVFIPLICYTAWGVAKHYRRRKQQSGPLESDAHSS